MKKLFFTLTVSALGFMNLCAQSVESYGFSSKIGSYQEITGGTIVGDTLSSTEFADAIFFHNDTVVKTKTTGVALPIGFDFKFSNQQMNRFAIGALHVFVGKDQVTATPNGVPTNDMSETGPYVIGVGPIAKAFITDSTEISYKLISEGTQKLIVQYKNMGFTFSWGTTAAEAVLNYQIHLYEGGNIEYYFKNWQLAPNFSRYAGFGIAGDNTSGVHMRCAKDSQSYNSTIKLTTSSTTTWNNTVYPEDNLVYTFTAPSTCETPAAQATNMVAKAHSRFIDGSFTKTIGTDRYLVLVSKDATMTALPVDSMMYAAGDSIGNAEVVSFDTTNIFKTKEILSENNDYTIFVYSANTYCADGTKYNTVDPLNETIKTMPVKPTAMTATATGIDGISLTVTKADAAHNVVVAYTTEANKNSYGQYIEGGYFGQPEGDVAVGDTLFVNESEFAGKVIYVGDAAGAIALTDADNSTAYFFAAWTKDTAGNYSTLRAETSESTWSIIPFSTDFTKMEKYSTPIGWSTEGSEFITDNDYNQMKCDIRTPNANGLLNSFTTNFIQLNDGSELSHRITFDYNAYIWQRFNNIPYTNQWAKNDTVEVQISTDGINFTSLATYTADNKIQHLDAKTYHPMRFTIDKSFAGEKIQVRLRWVTSISAQMYIKNLKVIEIAACDYATELKFTENTHTTQFELDWTPNSNAAIWEVRYRTAPEEDRWGNIVSDPGEWSDNIEALCKPFTVKGLLENTSYQVQVRNKCSITSVSEWSTIATFKTGYALPYSFDFTADQFSNGWDGYLGEFIDTTILSQNSNIWRRHYQLNYLYAQKYSVGTSWAVLPTLNLGDKDDYTNHTLSFDLKYVKSEQHDTVATDSTQVFGVAISVDGGKTFLKANTLKTWANADSTLEKLPAEGTRVSIPLNNYRGLVRLAYYIGSNTITNDSIIIDNVSVAATCAPATNAQVSDITLNSAKITWEGEGDNWLTFCRKEGSTERNYTAQTGKELVLTDLDEYTSYEVGITKSCAAGDTAQLVIVPFSTLFNGDCVVPTDLAASVTQNSATLSWVSPIRDFEIVYGEKEGEMASRIVKGTSYTLLGLVENITYVFKVRSICAAGDTSAFSAEYEFTTKAITCFPVKDIMFTPTHKTVTVNFTSAAEVHEYAFKAETEDVWTTANSNASPIEVTGLTATTKYNFKMRAICSEGDTSAWSLIHNFETIKTPECIIPSALTAEGATETSVTISWTADLSNVSWDLRYRQNNITKWENVEGIEETSYELTDLNAGSTYLWSVKAICEDNESNYATQATFETEEGTYVENVTGGQFEVFANNGIINILNVNAKYVSNIEIFTVDGRMIGSHSINATENIIIPTEMRSTIAIVKLHTNDSVEVFKVMLP